MTKASPSARRRATPLAQLEAIDAASEQVTQVGARLIGRLQQVQLLAAAVARNDMPPVAHRELVQILANIASQAEIEIEYDLQLLERGRSRARANASGLTH